MICFGCMENKTSVLCPYCGFDDRKYRQPGFALQVGRQLAKRYGVGKVLGQGGFGITYIGYDTMLNIKVAIKEYYPKMFVKRENNIPVVSWKNAEGYGISRKSCQDLVTEARKMAMIDDIPEIVRIRDAFFENNTAYLVMDYVEGITLKRIVEKEGKLSYEDVVTYLKPIMRAMELVHQRGMIHRDISPDNIMFQANGKMKLLDLGASKEMGMQKGSNLGIKMNQSGMLYRKNGFSPIEQYNPNGDIGYWTDVYAMTATIYYCLTGKRTPIPDQRMHNDDEVQETIRNLAIPLKAKKGIQKGLSIDKNSRIQTMTELRHVFEPEKKKPKKKIVLPVAIAGGSLLLGIGVGMATLLKFEAPLKSGILEYKKTHSEFGYGTESVEDIEALEESANDESNMDFDRSTAMYELGLYFEYTEDYENAAFWYQCAVDLNNRDAMNNLGLFYQYGKGVETDLEKAFDLFKEGADLGSAAAMNNLGYLYFTGEGTGMDHDKAVEYFEKSARGGDNWGMYNLAACYEFGFGYLDKNKDEALKWYKAAKDAGNPEAEKDIERLS